MALVGALFTSGFRLIADIFLLIGLVLLRLLVMFLPAAAVIGVLAPMSSILRRMANLGGAAVINVVAFSVGAAVHTAAISAVLESANGAGMTLMALVLCIVLTLAALILMWPLLSFRLAFGSGGPRKPNMRRLGRHVANFVVTQGAVEKGVEDAERPKAKETPNSDSETSRRIPADRPLPGGGNTPGSRQSSGVDAESARIYEGLRIKEGATDKGSSVPTETPDRDESERRTYGHPEHGATPRSSRPEDAVLVGAVVPRDVGPQPSGPDQWQTSSADSTKPPPMRIYDPSTKRTETYRGSRTEEE